MTDGGVRRLFRFMTKTHKGPALLGQKATLPASPDEAELDLVPNPHPGVTYLVRFAAPEFTSLCPVTGQPDFAHLVIDYAPSRMAGRIEIAEALSRELPQSRRLPRGLHAADRPSDLVAALTPQLAAHRRLLVSARRHTDRRLLADRRAARRPVAARPGRAALSRAWVRRYAGRALWPTGRRASSASIRRRQIAQRDHRRAVGDGAIRVGMRLDEQAGDADRHRRPRQHGHEAPFAARGRAEPAGLLDRMGGVEDHRSIGRLGQNRQARACRRRARCSRSWRPAR